MTIIKTLVQVKSTWLQNGDEQAPEEIWIASPNSTSFS